MARVSGSYKSVVGGVSEQNPQSRRSGQHFEQVNMISDPVRGLARRHGSIMQDETIIGYGTNYPYYLEDTASSKVITFYVGGKEYDLIARTQAGHAGALGFTSFAQCFDKEARSFIPITYDMGDPVVVDLMEGGVSASANVGRYLFLAGNNIIPSATSNDAWGALSNQQLLAGWIRGGAYSRTFKVKVTPVTGAVIEAEYKTKASSYPGVLDTSDIPALLPDGETPNPEYQKEVNDRTNEYNSAVTAWIGEAAADITPENIAQKLVDALILVGVPAQRIDGYVVITDPAYKEIALEDSGDNSLVRSVGNVVENINLVSARHYVGKIIKVEPENSTGDPVYLKAFAKDGVSTGWAEVVWREAAGFETIPETVFCYATVNNNRLYIAASAARLSAISGVPEVPGYETNSVGDDVSAPIPAFFGRRIDYLGVFQDRLVIGAGSTLFFSRPGDYLNWFRQSVLTIEDDDPWEGFALGAEDDTIKHSVLYDRNLLLYGKRFQYVVNGRQAFTPANASVAILAAYEDALDAPPRASGNYVYYSKYTGAPGKEVSSLHQMQPSYVADVSDSYLASQQLDTYLQGKPVEIVTMTAPNMVILRTDRDRQRIFIYSYLDNPNNNERLFDSWSKWTWNEGVGSVIGISRYEADILVYTIKRGKDRDGVDQCWVACEQFVRDTDLSDYPYLDSLRPLAQYLSPEASAYFQSNLLNPDEAAVAIERGPDEQFLGDSLTNLDRFEEVYGDLVGNTWVGYEYDSFVTPTNPYARDRNDQAILGGRMTLNKVKVAVTDTGGMKCSVLTRGTTRESLNFVGRIIGQPNDLIGRQPIVTTNLTPFIGGEVSECRYTLSASRWLPLTINSIEWQGQLFFNTRRA